jgi:uncharacterized protein
VDTGLFHIYLPIAEMTLDPLALLAIGGGVGMLSGLFGVGGGFLITPLLIFMGVPPAVAAATGANVAIGPSIAGILAHMRRGAVDLRMGGVLVAGGLVGSAASVWLFGLLTRLGQIDLVVSLSYVFLLGGVGLLMLNEAVRAWRRRLMLGGASTGRMHEHNWLHRMPFKLRFPKSKLYISALGPLALGAIVGLVSGIMGVGGGFLLVPAMIYGLGMSTSVVIGTSLLQVLVVSANVTFLQSAAHQTVDVVLAFLLIASAGVGAPFGAAIGAKLRADQLRALMALLVLAVAVGLGTNLVTPPNDTFTTSLERPEGETPAGAR